MKRTLSLLAGLFLAAFAPAQGLPDYYSSYIKIKADAVQALQGRQRDGFIFWCDTHVSANARRSPEIMKAVMPGVRSPKVIWGGDASPAYTDSVEKWWSIQKEMNGKIMEWSRIYNVRGNHDLTCMKSRTERIGYTLVPEVTASLLAESMSRDVVRDISNPAANYYYFDEREAKIRYVVLDAFQKFKGAEKANGVAAGILDDQLQWMLSEAFWKAPKGYSLVIALHDADFWRNKKVYGKAAEAVSAFANHRTVEFAGRSFDFGKRKDLELLFIIGGHHHHDMQLYEDGIMRITCCCDATYRDYTRNPFSVKTDRKKSVNEQSFEYFSIDRDARKVHTVKVGVGNDRTFNLRPTVIKVGKRATLKPEKPAVSWHIYDCASAHMIKERPAVYHWEMTNSVATVSDGGKVEALSPGEAIAVALDADNNAEIFPIRVR